jgi:hypothetical protein
MYHADRDKGKCDLHGGRRQVVIEWEGWIYSEIELTPHFHPIQLVRQNRAATTPASTSLQAEAAAELGPDDG